MGNMNESAPAVAAQWVVYCVEPASGNGPRYVGQTCNPRRRWLEHQRAAAACLVSEEERRDAHSLHRAMAAEKHTVRTLVKGLGTRAAALSAESEWIVKLATLAPHGHNQIGRTLYTGEPGSPDWALADWFAERWDVYSGKPIFRNGIEWRPGPGSYAQGQAAIYFARDGRRLS
jgi:predicted GIY-YIG superfamily endonuclease